jgi:hypothetical protein
MENREFRREFRRGSIVDRGRMRNSICTLSYNGGVTTRQHAGPGPASPDVAEPSLAERARTLIGTTEGVSPIHPGRATAGRLMW